MRPSIHFFPKMDRPLPRALAPPDDNNPMYLEGAPIADFISFFHIRWPVADAALMAGVRQHIKSMIALSRESWDSIEAETDDDLEWLPNAHQKSPFESVQVSAEQIAAWRGVLDQAEEVIDGKKLVPHWRFTKGFNLARVFDAPQPFDTVLWITGPAALPYLEDGPVSTVRGLEQRWSIPSAEISGSSPSGSTEQSRARRVAPAGSRLPLRLVPSTVPAQAQAPASMGRPSGLPAAAGSPDAPPRYQRG